MPDTLFVAPGTKAPNRVGLSKYASYINSCSIDKYGRPLVIAMSADLADSTNISGFAKGFEDSKDLGLYNYKTNKPIRNQNTTTPKCKTNRTNTDTDENTNGGQRTERI